VGRSRKVNSMVNDQKPQPSLEICLLGSFHSKADGHPVDEHRWLRRSAKLLVKLLAITARHRLHREQITDLLWTEQDFTTALNNLNKAVYMARRALEPDLEKGSDSRFILTHDQHIILQAPDALFIDVEEFERLSESLFRKNDIVAGQKALKLYKGDLLVEDPYEDWLAGKRESLRILYRKTAIKTAELSAAAGLYQPATEILERLAEEDLIDEYVQHQLVRLYAQTGRKYQALKQLDRCRAALLALGLEPEPETLKLEAALRKGTTADLKFGHEQTGRQDGQPSVHLQATAPRIRQLTFQQGGIQAARFTYDGEYVIYAAAWGEEPYKIYKIHKNGKDSFAAGQEESGLFSVSPTGELGLALERRFLRGYASVATLARQDFHGGVPRKILENVQWADWCPARSRSLKISTGNECFAVVREVRGKNCLEYPAGKILYETGGWISHVRFSPDGKNIALIDHPTPADDSGIVAVVDLDGEKKVLTKNWISIQGLAWNRKTQEIWFTAASEGNARKIHAVNLQGKERLVYQGTGSLTLQDIEVDGGRALVKVENTRIRILAKFDDDKERDLSWHDWSLVRDLSSDGSTILFTEAGESGGSDFTTYIRKTDGSAVLQLGTGSALALSPDGKFALVCQMSSPQRLLLLPIGAGEARAFLPVNSDQSYYQPWACFFPDGRRILFSANEKEQGTKLYLQAINGEPVCLTPDEEGIEISSPHSISPDGRQVAIINPENIICLLEIENRKCAALKKLGENFLFVRWSVDGRYIFIRERGQVPALIYRYDLASGQMEEWLELTPKNQIGVHEILRVLLTPDGRSYAYSFVRELSDLYLIEDLQ
jgi:DNA-binding SARP family transcriptional activator/WD40 repeat protein